MVIAMVSMLPGCSSSTGAERKPAVVLTQVKATVPSEADTPCPVPVVLPNRAISAAETVNLWSVDRNGLRVCESRRAAAVATIRGAQ